MKLRLIGSFVFSVLFSLSCRTKESISLTQGRAMFGEDSSPEGKEAKASDESKESQEGSDPFQIQKISETFYRKRMKDHPELWLAMEKIGVNNINLWKKYIDVQSDSRVLMQTQITDSDGIRLQKHSPGDGSYHFRKVLENTDILLNEVWVSYITSQDPPEKIPESMKYYSSDDIRSKREEGFAKQIKMFMTVTSSPKALITTHLGIAVSVEGVLAKRPKGISLDLHSFAANIMLLRNPNRRYMINAPVPAMEFIMLKALPHGVFVGTKERYLPAIALQKMTLEEYRSSHPLSKEESEELKEQIRSKAERSLLRIAEIVEKAEEKGRPKKWIEEKIKEKKISLSFLEKDTEGNYVLSEEKINMRFEKNLTSFIGKKFKSKRLDDDASGPLKTAFGTLFNLYKSFPPILSVRHISTFKKTFTIYDHKTDEPFLTVDGSNRADYEWMFDSTFAPAGLTHYIVTDLQALAAAR